MKEFFKLAAAISGCELVGILGTIFTINSIPAWYETLTKPVFSPPNWIFGPVWTILYFMMGVSIYLIIKNGWKKKKVKTAAMFFFAQLALNFIWTPVFFGLKSPDIALFIIIAMWVLIILTINKFYAISKPAAYLLIPYLLWVSFATILNAAILILN